MPPHELATLAMLYDDHPGKHNRHSSQRWMRRFADVAAVAGDALEMGDRPLAICVLCEIVPLEDAIKLTRPPELRSDSIGTFVSAAPAGGLANIELDFSTMARYATGPVSYPPIVGLYDI